jgi:DNA-binding XRE family transcriptional regulator
VNVLNHSSRTSATIVQRHARNSSRKNPSLLFRTVWPGGYPSRMSEPDPMCYVLRDLRSRAGLTQKQLATELGIAARTIIRWEGGDQTPNLTDLRRLAGRFGVSVAQMVGEAGPDAERSI